MYILGKEHKSLRHLGFYLQVKVCHPLYSAHLQWYKSKPWTSVEIFMRRLPQACEVYYVYDVGMASIDWLMSPTRCGDIKTLTFTVYRVKHKKHQTIVHEKEEPLVKQLTAGHTDVIYVNGIELRQRLKSLTPIKSETNNSLLSDKQVYRKTHAAQVNLKLRG